MPTDAGSQTTSDFSGDLSSATGCVETMSFTDTLGLALLEALPAKSKVLMRTIVDDRDQLVCSQIQVFLQDNGYDVVRLIARNAPERTKRIELIFGEYGIELTIAPRRPCSQDGVFVRDDRP